MSILSKLTQFFRLLNRYLDFSDKSEYTKKGHTDELLGSLFDEDKNLWLLLRCSKCNKKAIPMVKKGRIIPVSTYCRHCGSEKFFLEKKIDIERLDTIYALHSADLFNVKKEMVSSNNAQMDRELSSAFVSQTPSNAWESKKFNSKSNVVSFEKYYSKK